ncbi:hypothetical protein [Hyphomicrobium sp.]|uniref:hypothetical protein n=1 Tax=Hyphomicrobium sp. TaxID=82 RepID=UPI002D78FDB4|nr:hypothetical protein [Hyphomicrobium sp.]HET6390200.1 hypothetical protein [Hyphomicrobium sp.]
MTSSVLLKIFAGMAALSATAYCCLWYAAGEPNNGWLLRLAGAAFLIALVMGVVNPETRPRLMLRFLAALFALGALISFAADITQPSVEGAAPGSISLMQHLETGAPAFLEAFERSVTTSIEPALWNPVLTTVLSLPGTLIFLLLAIACGYLGRPRRRIRIFANDY